MVVADDNLAAGLSVLQLSLTDKQQQQLLTFIALLQKWNNAFNLTALRTPEEMVTQHLLDSLSILPFIGGGHLLDVGSGAGLPGLPLAVARPDWAVVLLDSNGKKTRFMQQAVLELGLSNVSVIKTRIEQYRPERAFDTVVSRAFTSLAGFIEACRQLGTAQTRFYAMKGQYPQEELQALVGSGYSAEIIKLAVPGLSAQRHLISLRKTEQT